MKRLISALTVCFLCAAPLFALGQKSKMELLGVVAWKASIPIGSIGIVSEKDGWYYLFKDNKMTSIITKNGETIKSRGIMPFYLSDTVDKEFDASKVGKSDNGKYLVYVMDMDASKEAHKGDMKALQEEDYEKLNTTVETSIANTRSYDSKRYLTRCLEIVQLDDGRLFFKQIYPEPNRPDNIMRYFRYDGKLSMD